MYFVCENKGNRHRFFQHYRYRQILSNPHQSFKPSPFVCTSSGALWIYFRLGVLQGSPRGEGKFGADIGQSRISK